MGSRFHVPATLFVKKFFLTSVLEFCGMMFSGQLDVLVTCVGFVYSVNQFDAGEFV